MSNVFKRELIKFIQFLKVTNQFFPGRHEQFIKYDIEMTDSGVYKCVVESQFHLENERTFIVTVESKYGGI